ncbi:MAG: hypothetical protein ABSC03_15555 [Verrucomicrobiota bacterium]|jgi:hypothetical protein
MIHLTAPLTEEKIRALKVGDAVLIFGGGFTGALPPGLSASSLGVKLAL